MLPVGPGPMSSGSDFKDLIEFIIGAFIEPIIYLILGLAVVYFMWNITEVIRKGDNPEELAQRQSILGRGGNCRHGFLVGACGNPHQYVFYRPDTI